MSSGYYCSPKNNNLFTCFSNEDLVKIAKYLQRETGSVIYIPSEFTTESRKKLWINIKRNIGNLSKCSEDYCMIKNQDIIDILGKATIEKKFRPEKPANWKNNKTAWLSTVDIRKVMRQYEEKYPDFKFIGPTPIDFDKRFNKYYCVNNELCNFNLEKLLKQGKKRIGVVFNLDPHHMRGSHWVSLFIDVNTGGSYFFCSYGVKPNNKIQILMERIFNQGNKLIKEGKIDVNRMSDNHTVARTFTVISKNKIKVVDGKLFVKNMLLGFGSFNGKDVRIDQKTMTKIVDVKKNIVTLEDDINIGQNKQYNIVAMKSFRPFYNDTRFQFKNTECGVYSIYFIESFLQGKNHDEIVSKIIHDNEMNKKRNIYYRPNIN